MLTYTASLEAKINQTLDQIARETRPSVLKRRRIGLLKLLWIRSQMEGKERR